MLRKLFLFVLLLAILAPVYLFSQVFESQPLVIQTTTPDAEDARKTKALIKRTLRLLETRQQATLTASEADLNAVIAFLDRGISRLSGQFRVTDQGLDGIFTVKLPEVLPLEQYINLFLTLLPSENGLVVADLQLGGLKFPGPLALELLQSLADLFLGEQFGSRTLGAIEQVGFTANQMSLSFTSGAELVSLKDQLRIRLQEFRNDYDEIGDQDKIAFYYQQLIEMRQLNLGEGQFSLTRYMAPLFQLAERKSQQNSPTDENQAALYALAIYLGSEKLQQFTGKLYDSAQPQSKTNRTNVVLAGRRDLRQHFLVSAALKLLADAELGFVVGEFKELLDSNQGGSGFSFIDLAADRAGLAFADRATRSPESAREFQRIMVKAQSEASYFSDFSDLEEGLNERRFIEKYQDIDSQEYRQIVRLIDERLNKLPLYQ